MPCTRKGFRCASFPPAMVLFAPLRRQGRLPGEQV
jgi:hypothetical protein